MTGHRPGPGGGPGDREPDRPDVPEGLEDLDRRLREIRFRPRPSLQAKIMARRAAGGRGGAGGGSGGGGSEGGGPAGPDGRPRWLRPLIATAAAALAGLAIWAVAADELPEIDDLFDLDDLFEVEIGALSGTPDVARAGDAARAAAARIDRCCADLDGGIEEDDGVLVFVGPDEAVLGIVVYEDLDGSGGYTPGDAIRIGPDHRPERGEPPWAGLVTLDHCCLDYDAGGPDDDGVFLIGRPPDRLIMAAVYEDRDGDGVASAGDLVRYVIH